MTGWELDGKVGIVTGGASGIGMAIAETLAREGAVVVVFDLSPGSAPKSAALALEVDVSDEPAVAAAFRTVDERFDRLDFLVNNAGIDIETVPSPEWLADPLDRLLVATARRLDATFLTSDARILHYAAATRNVRVQDAGV